MYFQCLLRNGIAHQIAYIEQRGATVGYKVEIDGVFWEVMQVADKGLDKKYLNQLQQYNYKPFGSIL